MESIPHKNNVYAFTVENIVKHISEVESGRKGYYCMGCGRKMQAKKGDKRAQHFAHDPSDVLNKGKCTYSDETYRHKLAKEILQRIKQIKVPPLYKSPPPGVEGKPYKLKDAEFIKAGGVKIELTFFEDQEGCIRYGRNINIEPGSSKFLLIKPDVTFFDENDNPILLIEIVITHKITDEKFSRIRKLGINTIQITIPKDSPEEIENSFFKTTRTQWVYNYEQEQTAYVQPATRDSEGVPPLDDFQRKLLEAAESYECRAAQINNLIRGLNKCLESQPYFDFTEHITAEIRRVERNTEGNRERLQELQGVRAEEVKGEFRLEEGDVTRQEEEIKLEEGDVTRQEEEINAKSRALDQETSEYEERYYRKRKELEQLQREYQPDCSDEIERITGDFERLGTNANEYRDRNVEIKREEAEFEQYVRKEGNRLEEEEGRISDLIAGIGARRSGLSEKYRNLEEGVRAHYERETVANEGSIEQSIATVKDEFERDRRKLLSTVEDRNSDGFPGISRGFRDLLETRKRLSSLAQSKDYLRRMRKFKELFDTGAYKNWI